MFFNKMTPAALSEGLTSAGPWKPFAQIDDRAAWNTLRETPRLKQSIEAISSYAEQVLISKIDDLPATMYMEFIRSGDRQRYEENYFRRRAALSHLIIAECLTAQSRYLDKIIDHIWAILSEPYWCVPAHNFADTHEMVVHKRPNPWNVEDPLPVPGDEYLDLFNCETAAILSEANYLLAPVLQDRVPSLYHTIHREVERRTLALIEGPGVYGWFHGKNNWTPWCAHNLLLTAAYNTDDSNRLISIATKLMVPMQRFFDSLEVTGSCIEGPSYWVVSAGRLCGFIELVESRFGISLGFEKNKKFSAFGSHIACFHIDENRFVNFADGTLDVDLDHGLLAKYAKMIDNRTLAGMLAEDIDRVATRKRSRPVCKRGHNEYNRQILIHLTRSLFWTSGLPEKANIAHKRDIWLSDMEVMVARQFETPGRGLMMSAIAGTNDLDVNHHSHNDVGHFSLYLDGTPAIIDLGQGDYTKFTFGHERSDAWHIGSEGHNVPQINGAVQRAGIGAEARDVLYSADGELRTLEFDAAPSYFEDASERRVLRKITFNHANGVARIEDKVELPEELETFVLPLLIGDFPTQADSPGELIISINSKQLQIVAENLEVASVETIEVKDKRHLSVWGPQLKQVLWKAKDTSEPQFKLTIMQRA